MVEVADTYLFLLGRWRVERVFTDHRLQHSGRFAGTATVAPSEDDDEQTARYFEVGELRLGSYRGTACRRLVVVPRADGAVTLTFEDGHRFLACDLRSGRCRGTHMCQKDRYEMCWSVHGPDEIVEEWRVLGPDKDYEARCVLRRDPTSNWQVSSGDVSVPQKLVDVSEGRGE
jgi:Family of unknown function (DUF6314)